MWRGRVRRTLSRLLRALGVFIALFLVAAFTFILRSRPIPLSFRTTPDSIRHSSSTAGLPHYLRDEVDTFYTFPEWYIVWSYQAKADFQRASLPSGYSYFGDIVQFWQAYSRMYAATRRAYPVATGDHIMLVVIGSSFSVEYALKGAYENTVGRLTEWMSGHQMVPEDAYAGTVASDYAAFVHNRPFYEFSYAKAFRGLWSKTPFQTKHLPRVLERRFWLSLDYAVESLYCELIQLATHATYGYEEVTTAAWIKLSETAKKAELIAPAGSIKIARDFGANEAIIEIPRYQEFTTVTQKLLKGGAEFSQIAGNQLIVFSAIAPGGSIPPQAHTQLLLEQPILTGQGRTRAVFLVKVSDLNETLSSLESQGLQVEHLYDY